jgi:hypothetical protein
MNDIVVVLISAATFVVTCGCLIFSVMYHRDVEELMANGNGLRKKLVASI